MGVNIWAPGSRFGLHKLVSGRPERHSAAATDIIMEKKNKTLILQGANGLTLCSDWFWATGEGNKISTDF